MLTTVNLKAVRAITEPCIVVVSAINADIEKYICSISHSEAFDGLSNPTNEDLQYLKGIVLGRSRVEGLDMLLEMTGEPVERLAKAVDNTIEILRNMGKNQTIIDNVYLKFAHWLNLMNTTVLDPKITALQYFGAVSLHTMLFFNILREVGVSTYIISATPINEEYFDRVTGYSILEPNMQSIQDIDVLRKKAATLGDNEAIATNVWLKGENLNEIFTPYVSRKVNSSASVKSALIKVNGVWDRSTYPMDLYEMYNKCPEATTIINTTFVMTTPNDITALRTKHRKADMLEYVQSLSLELNTSADVRSVLIKETYAIISTLGKHAEKTLLDIFFVLKNLKMGKNFADRRYLYFLETAPLTQLQGYILYLISCMMYDVVIFNPNNIQSDININMLYEMNYTEKQEMLEFPVARQSFAVQTVAYNAERDLDIMLYDGSAGVYRDKQFQDGHIIYLRPMHEEIDILWDKQISLRQGFTTQGNQVTMPVMFAEILGVKDEDTTSWCKRLDSFLKLEDIVLYNHERQFLTDDDGSWNFLPQVGGHIAYPIYSAHVMKDRRIVPDKLMKHNCYPPNYTYLEKNIQTYMIAKLQELFDLGAIAGVFKDGTENTVFNMFLLASQNQKFLRLLQNFDFVKMNPKVVYTWMDKAKIPQLDVIFLHYLSLLGFDVLILVPSGFNVLDTYITRKVFIEYSSGKGVDPFPVRHGIKDSVFEKFFRRRKP